MHPLKPAVAHPFWRACDLAGEEFEACAAADRNAYSIACGGNFVRDHLLLRRPYREEDPRRWIGANEIAALGAGVGVVLQIGRRIEPAQVVEAVTLAQASGDFRRAADDEHRVVGADVALEKLLDD